ncbi:MAG: DEAD/DEAH box helicase family protein [Fibrobacter sp.]|nr:DEAD/DEAH box helicase family protein [Fibrobacter sp.]
MNESDTRRKKIDPKLKEAGWEMVPESAIFTEQSAYEISPGRVANHERNPKKIDYLLVYKGIKIAIVEAKKDELDVSEGVAQAKEYAERMHIRFTYSCNGDKIWAIDMETGKEGFIEAFPSPDELWAKQFPVNNPLRDKLNAVPFNRDGGKSPRYYQEIAVNNVMDAIARKQERILLTLATGTGKTYIAFQICWKLFQARWNVGTTERIPRILFLSDRNILSNQALNDFGQFDENAMSRITPEEIRKRHGSVPKARSIYFSIFQTFMTLCSDGEALYKKYPQDFFDLIIVDECHRGAANDESRWRDILDYFQKAYHLGLTATPKRKINANTYSYFGKPVYEYSLKQGIEDGFLTPFRVRISKSNIDTYIYSDDDDVESGEVDPNKVYNENDFYQGNIKIRDRDEHRVKEFLEQINPDEKTIVFGATQAHAAILRDMINQHSKKQNPNYCKRVTSDDGDDGETDLKDFQDNEKTLPTILTTSQKLSTGVDAKNVRNIVLMRPVNNIIEFKQIIGRGTRLFEDKYFFTIYDFVGASQNFSDPEWDGEAICDKCGNYPCTCNKPVKPSKPPKPPKPCKVCGNLPCTCDAGDQKRKCVTITLSKNHVLQLNTEWTERFMFDGELITMEQFIKILFGKIPEFFKSDKDLRNQWADPQKRLELLEKLNDNNFSVERLRQIQKLTSNENCDILDILELIAYNMDPMERKARVEMMHDDIMKNLAEKQKPFIEFVLQQYIDNGFENLAVKQLPELVKMRYGTVKEACNEMSVDVKTLNRIFVEFQKTLYA